MAHKTDFDYLNSTLDAIRRSLDTINDAKKHELGDASLVYELREMRTQLDDLVRLYDPLCRAYGETTRSILVATERMYTASPTGELVQNITEMHPAAMRAAMYGMPGAPVILDEAKSQRQPPSERKILRVPTPSAKKRSKKKKSS